MKKKSTREIIKSFLVNTKVKVNYPITSIVSPWDSVIVFIHLDKLGEEPFEGFGVRQMDTLLSAIDVYDDPQIEIKQPNIIISTDHDRQEIRTSSPELNKLIKEPKYDALVSIETNKEVFELVLDINVPKDEMIKKTKIQRLFALEVYALEADENGASISVCNLNSGIGENEAKSKLEGSGNGKIIFNVDDISMLPQEDYNVKVYKNKQAGSQISVWRIKDRDEVEIIVTEKQ